MGSKINRNFQFDLNKNNSLVKLCWIASISCLKVNLAYAVNYTVSTAPSVTTTLSGASNDLWIYSNTNALTVPNTAVKLDFNTTVDFTGKLSFSSNTFNGPMWSSVGNFVSSGTGEAATFTNQQYSISTASGYSPEPLLLDLSLIKGSTTVNNYGQLNGNLTLGTRKNTGDLHTLNLHGEQLLRKRDGTPGAIVNLAGPSKVNVYGSNVLDAQFSHGAASGTDAANYYISNGATVTTGSTLSISYCDVFTLVSGAIFDFSAGSITGNNIVNAGQLTFSGGNLVIPSIDNTSGSIKFTNTASFGTQINNGNVTVSNGKTIDFGNTIVAQNLDSIIVDPLSTASFINNNYSKATTATEVKPTGTLNLNGTTLSGSGGLNNYGTVYLNYPTTLSGGIITASPFLNYKDFYPNNGELKSEVTENYGYIYQSLKLVPLNDNSTNLINVHDGSINNITGVNNKNQTLNYVTSTSAIGTTIDRIDNIKFAAGGGLTTFSGASFKNFVLCSIGSNARLLLNGLSISTLQGSKLTIADNASLEIRADNTMLDCPIDNSGSSSSNLTLSALLSLSQAINTVNTINIDGWKTSSNIYSNADVTSTQNITGFKQLTVGVHGKLTSNTGHTITGEKITNRGAMDLDSILTAAVDNNALATFKYSKNTLSGTGFNNYGNLEVSDGTIQNSPFNNYNQLSMLGSASLKSLMFNHFGSVLGTLNLDNSNMVFNLKGGTLNDVKGVGNTNQTLNVIGNFNQVGDIADVDIIELQQDNAIYTIASGKKVTGFSKFTIDAKTTLALKQDTISLTGTGSELKIFGTLLISGNTASIDATINTQAGSLIDIQNSFTLSQPIQGSGDIKFKGIAKTFTMGQTVTAKSLTVQSAAIVSLSSNKTATFADYYNFGVANIDGTVETSGTVNGFVNYGSGDVTLNGTISGKLLNNSGSITLPTLGSGSVDAITINHFGSFINTLKLGTNHKTLNLYGGTLTNLQAVSPSKQVLNVKDNSSVSSGTFTELDQLNIPDAGLKFDLTQTSIQAKTYNLANLSSLNLLGSSSLNGTTINLAGNIDVKGIDNHINTTLIGSAGSSLNIYNVFTADSDIGNTTSSIDINVQSSGSLTIIKNLNKFNNLSIVSGASFILQNLGKATGSITNNAGSVSLSDILTSQFSNYTGATLSISDTGKLEGSQFENFGIVQVTGNGKINNSIINNKGTILNPLTLSGTDTVFNAKGGTFNNLTGVKNNAQKLNFSTTYLINANVDKIDYVNINTLGSQVSLAGGQNIENFQTLTVDSGTSLILGTNTTVSGTAVNVNGTLVLNGNNISLVAPVLGSNDSVLDIKSSFTTKKKIDKCTNIKLEANASLTSALDITNFTNFEILDDAILNFSTLASLQGKNLSNAGVCNLSNMTADIGTLFTNYGTLDLSSSAKVNGTRFDNFGSITCNDSEINSLSFYNNSGTISNPLTFTKTNNVYLDGGQVDALTGSKSSAQTLTFLSSYVLNKSITNFSNIVLQNPNTKLTLSSNNFTGYDKFTISANTDLLLNDDVSFKGKNLHLYGSLSVVGSGVTLDPISGLTGSSLNIYNAFNINSTIDKVDTINIEGKSSLIAVNVSNNISNCQSCLVKGLVNMYISNTFTLDSVAFTNSSTNQVTVNGILKGLITNANLATLNVANQGEIQGSILNNYGTVSLVGNATVSSSTINNYSSFLGTLKLTSMNTIVNLFSGNFASLAGTPGNNQTLNVQSDLTATGDIKNIDIINVKGANTILTLGSSNAFLGYKYLNVEPNAFVNFNNSSGSSTSNISNKGSLIIPINQTLTLGTLTSSGVVKGSGLGSGVINFKDAINVQGGSFAIDLLGLNDGSQSINISASVNWLGAIQGVGDINLSNDASKGTMNLRNAISNVNNFNIAPNASLTINNHGSVSGNITLDGQIILSGGGLAPPSGTLSLVAGTAQNSNSMLSINANLGTVNTNSPVHTSTDITDLKHIAVNNYNTHFVIDHVVQGYTDFNIDIGSKVTLSSGASLSGTSLINNGSLELYSSDCDTQISGGSDPGNRVDIYTSYASTGKLNNISTINLKDNGLGTTQFDLGHPANFSQFNIEPSTTLSINNNATLSTTGLNNNGNLILNGGILNGNVSAGIAPSTSLKVLKESTTNGTITGIKTISVATDDFQKWSVNHAVSGFTNLTIQANAILSLNANGSLAGAEVINQGRLDINEGLVKALKINNQLGGAINGDLNLEVNNQILAFNGGGLIGNVLGKIGAKQSLQINGAATISGTVDGIDAIALSNNFTLNQPFTNYKQFVINANANLQMNAGASLSGSSLSNNGTLTLNGGDINGPIQGNSSPGSSLVFNAAFACQSTVSGIPNISLNANAIVDVAATFSDYNNFSIASSAILNININANLLGTGLFAAGTINLNGGAMLALNGSVGSVLNINDDFSTGGPIIGIGDLNANAGTINLNHPSLVLSAFTIKPGANVRLGAGLAASFIVNSGSLSLASNQTLGGNYQQSADGELIVQLQDSTHFSKLNIIGNVNLADTTVIKVGLIGQGTLIQDQDLFPVLTTNGTLTAGTVQVTSVVDSAVIKFEPIVSANALNLKAIRVPYAKFSSSPIGNAVGSTLDALRRQNPSPVMTKILAGLDASPSDASTVKALGELAPVMNAGQLALGNACQLQALDKVALRMESNRMVLAGRNLGYVAGEISQGYSVTPLIYGAFSKQQAEGEIPGFSQQTLGLGILTDTLITEGLQVGLGLSVGQGRVTTEGMLSKTDLKSLQVLGYASYDEGAWFSDLVLAGAINQMQDIRQVAFAKASANAKHYGGQYSVKTRVGYAMSIAGLEITPMASIQFGRSTLKDFSEQSNQGVALHYHSLSKNISSQAGLGFKINYRGFGLAQDMLADFHLMAYRNIKAEPLSFLVNFVEGGPSFVATGLKPKQNSLVLGTTITLAERNDSALSFSYDLELKPNFMGHAMFFKYKW